MSVTLLLLALAFAAAAGVRAGVRGARWAWRQDRMLAALPGRNGGLS